jgi:hypothetical protein
MHEDMSILVGEIVQAPISVILRVNDDARTALSALDANAGPVVLLYGQQEGSNADGAVEQVHEVGHRCIAETEPCSLHVGQRLGILFGAKPETRIVDGD